MDNKRNSRGRTTREFLTCLWDNTYVDPNIGLTAKEIWYKCIEGGVRWWNFNYLTAGSKGTYGDPNEYVYDRGVCTTVEKNDTLLFSDFYHPYG